MLPFIPNVDIVNTVYLRNSNGISCGSTADYVELYKNHPVTYCFEIKNKGTSYLHNIVIVVSDLSVHSYSISSLAPGESIIVVFAATIAGDLNHNAVVTANPTRNDGTDLPNRPMSLIRIPPRSTTWNAIHCFNVTNNGDTYLDQVSVADGELNITDKSIGWLVGSWTATIDCCPQHYQW